MAVLYVVEYAQLGYDPQGPAAVPEQPTLSKQTLPIGGSSVVSAPFQPATKYVRLHCDAICSINFGINPVATTTTERMAANQTEYSGVPRGAGFQVAVIANI